MSQKVNPTLLGAFVLGGFGLLLAALFLFGSGDYFKARHYNRVYFNESVGGLDVGAPVEFRGVRVGTVKQIDLLFREKEKDFVIPVTIQIEDERMASDFEVRPSDEERSDILTTMIDRGLRAQLAPQSLLTGKLKITLDFFPGTPARFTGLPGEHPELPTLDTPVRRALDKLSQLPLDEIVTEAHASLKALTGLLSSEDTRRLVGQVDEVMAEIRSLAAELRTNAAVLVTGMQPLLKNLDQISMNMAQTLDVNSPTRIQAEAAMVELRKTMESLRHVTEYLEVYPEALLRGKQDE